MYYIILIYFQCHKTRSLELNRHEGRKLIIKELDKQINGDSSKKSIDDMKAKENARKRRKRTKLKYANAKEELEK